MAALHLWRAQTRIMRAAADLARASGDGSTGLRIESTARSYERGVPLRLP